VVIVSTVLLLCLAPAFASASDPVHWGYDGEVAPEHWGDLSPDFAACAAGKEQSPVDIPATAPVNPPGLRFNYQPSALNITNNGHTIQVNCEGGSILEIAGAAYPLVQFHLHALSEHTLDGAHTAMELHLVHKNTSGRLAVVRVAIVDGAHNPAYEPILAHMPAEEGEPETIHGASLNAAALLPAEQSYCRYHGSLTTPPCTEGVTGFVMAAPVELSTAQLAAFQNLYDHNYRPVQPLNERTFLLTTTQPTGGPSRALVAGLIGLCLLAVTLLWALFRRATRGGSGSRQGAGPAGSG
jgi:carbonic anhydrase